jgi:hypothetical protein
LPTHELGLRPAFNIGVVGTKRYSFIRWAVDGEGVVHKRRGWHVVGWSGEREVVKWRILLVSFMLLACTTDQITSADAFALLAASKLGGE